MGSETKTKKRKPMRSFTRLNHRLCTNIIHYKTQRCWGNKCGKSFVNYYDCPVTITLTSWSGEYENYCCPGYEQKSTEPLVCSFKCEECLNGYCATPSQCACNTGYKLTSNNTCIPHCSKECVHGQCIAPDTCQCDTGYRMSSDNICEPVCSKRCGKGKCVAPETCQCNQGYQIASDYTCEPSCSRGCGHGKCVAPETCECRYGHKMSNSSGLCEPYCESGCPHGTCTGADLCKCDPGYVLDIFFRCSPHCVTPCGNGSCTQPNTCMCSPGYIVDVKKLKVYQSRGPLCIPKCTNCQGTCEAPNHCVCKPPLIAKNTTILSLACEKPYSFDGFPICNMTVCVSSNETNETTSSQVTPTNTSPNDSLYSATIELTRITTDSSIVINASILVGNKSSLPTLPDTTTYTPPASSAVARTFILNITVPYVSPRGSRTTATYNTRDLLDVPRTFNLDSTKATTTYNFPINTNKEETKYSTTKIPWSKTVHTPPDGKETTLSTTTETIITYSTKGFSKNTNKRELSTYNTRTESSTRKLKTEVTEGMTKKEGTRVTDGIFLQRTTDVTQNEQATGVSKYSIWMYSFMAAAVCLLAVLLAVMIIKRRLLMAYFFSRSYSIDDRSIEVDKDVQLPEIKTELDAANRYSPLLCDQ